MSLQYPLKEKIGNPELFIGREKEMTKFQKWLNGIPKQLSKSRAILARKKSGKTAFVQRLFNKLWVENRAIVPFYIEIKDRNIWYPDFAIEYYQRFASQYISFLERDPAPLHSLLSLEEIRNYGETHGMDLFVKDVGQLEKHQRGKNHDLMWLLACEAPQRFAHVYNTRVLVMIDEFQNINHFIFRDEQCTNRDETMAGSYHDLSESKIAPMLVTGSYVGWLVRVIRQYLEAGRLKKIALSPYLTESEGLEAVYKYAEHFEIPITNETAILLNLMCFSDPFFISCVIQSEYDDKDLTTPEGVAATVNFELTDQDSEMADTWEEYINRSVDRINNQNAKNILLFLSKHVDQEWTHLELKKELQLELAPKDILRQLHSLVQADLIQKGISDIAFRGLKDGTLHLILRNRFEQEISSFAVDLKKEFLEDIEKLKKQIRAERGRYNQLSGRVAEDQLATAFRTRGRFSPSVYFQGMDTIKEQNWIDVRARWKFQRGDGKELEIDVKVESETQVALLVEVKKTQTPVGKTIIKTFLSKIQAYTEQHPEQTVVSGLLALGGFTEEAQQLCKTHSIGTATTMLNDDADWSR